MKVKIFTEGGSDIGLGHISRCSALYDEIVNRKIDVEFIIYGYIDNVAFLKERIVKNINWMSEDFLNSYVSNTDYCIVDSYLASEDLYRIISNKSKKALFIDDNIRINYPKGIIVNPSIYVDDLCYPRNNNNIYFLGPEYIILRSYFVNNERNNINKNVKQVLITMGGSDIRSLTPMIIKHICNKYSDIRFCVVNGNVSYNIDFDENIELSNIQVYYNIDAKLMKSLMLKSDFAITAAGQTIYELLATQTPFIPIKTVDNQSNNISGLKKINPFQVIIEHDEEYLLEKLEKEFETMLSRNKRQALVNLYKNQIDGLGSKRIIDSLLME